MWPFDNGRSVTNRNVQEVVVNSSLSDRHNRTRHFSSRRLTYEFTCTYGLLLIKYGRCMAAQEESHEELFGSAPTELSLYPKPVLSAPAKYTLGYGGWLTQRMFAKPPLTNAVIPLMLLWLRAVTEYTKDCRCSEEPTWWLHKWMWILYRERIEPTIFYAWTKSAILFSMRKNQWIQAKWPS